MKEISQQTIELVKRIKDRYTVHGDINNCFICGDLLYVPFTDQEMKNKHILPSYRVSLRGFYIPHAASVKYVEEDIGLAVSFNKLDGIFARAIHISGKEDELADIRSDIESLIQKTNK